MHLLPYGVGRTSRVDPARTLRVTAPNPARPTPKQCSVSSMLTTAEG
jgi:hypothetical protein